MFGTLVGQLHEVQSFEEMKRFLEATVSLSSLKELVKWKLANLVLTPL